MALSLSMSMSMNLSSVFHRTLVWIPCVTVILHNRNLWWADGRSVRIFERVHVLQREKELGVFLNIICMMCIPYKAQNWQYFDYAKHWYLPSFSFKKVFTNYKCPPLSFYVAFREWVKILNIFCTETYQNKIYVHSKSLYIKLKS